MVLSSLPRRGTALLRRLTKRSSSNFKFAFLFLRPDQRAALERVYEYCRVVDDIVDERNPGAKGEEEAHVGLALWRSEVEKLYAAVADANAPLPETELGRSLVESVAAFDLPREAFDEIIEGCAMDLERSTYDTMEELELYCYRVASCVGLLCIGIFGDQGEPARRYARHLGLALQYTNILRDVAEDAGRGRIYIPSELIEKHGLNREDIHAARYDDRFLALAENFADLAEAEYALAWAEFPNVEHRRGLLPAEIMGRTYHQILAEIRAQRFNVYTLRASLRRRDKLRVAAVAMVRTNLPDAATGLSSSFSGPAGGPG